MVCLLYTSNTTADEASLSSKARIISEDGKAAFHEQVARAEAEAAKHDKRCV